MASLKSELLDALEELTEAEFKDFRWRLCNSEKSSFKPIPRGKLENASRHDVVDIMMQQYGDADVGIIAIRVLRSMTQNQLANQLKGNLQKVCALGQEDAGGTGGTGGTGGAGGAGGARAEVAAGGQTSGVSVKIDSSNGGSVKAPVLQGGVFNGPVTFN